MRAFLLLIACLQVVAHAGDIRIQEPWIRAVPPSAPATAAFMVIENTGPEPVWLTGARASFASDVRPMITTVKTVDGAEVAGMEFVDTFEIPPLSKRVLEPGGDHIMLMKLREVPRAGDACEIVLTFKSKGGTEEQTVKADVR